MSLKYGLNFTIRYATCHIVKPFEFNYWSLVTRVALWPLCDDEAMLPNQIPGKHKMSMTILMNLSHWRPSLYRISEDVFMRNLASRHHHPFHTEMIQNLHFHNFVRQTFMNAEPKVSWGHNKTTMLLYFVLTIVAIYSSVSLWQLVKSYWSNS